VTSSAGSGPTFQDVLRARERIEAHVRRTPLVRSESLSNLCDAAVHLKLESLQLTRAFKLRGALNAALSHVERLESQADGHAHSPALITASAGNHGIALALAARLTGLRAIIFTPADAPRTKLEGIRRYGADSRATGRDYDDAERQAKALAASTGAPFISGYSHPDVIAGAGTVALEILEELPDVDTFVVPVGGGGLVSGVAVVAAAISTRTRVIGVEAEASPGFTESLRKGRITEVAVKPSLADGLTGNLEPDAPTFALVQRLGVRLLQASEHDLAEAIRALAANEGLVVEGAGAAGVAALLKVSSSTCRVSRDTATPGGRDPGVPQLLGHRIAVIVSGGNIDPERLETIL
jgi:threonine dehydratase